MLDSERGVIRRHDSSGACSEVDLECEFLLHAT